MSEIWPYVCDLPVDLEPGALERKWRKEAWNKCRTTDGFTYPSPSKHRTGLGDTSGNFNQIHNKKHDWPTFMPRGGNEKKTKQDILNQPNYPAPRNILTSPVKRGSYGYTTKNYLGKGSEFSYVSDPYSRPREMEMEERKAFKEKTAIFGQGRPFNTASHALDCYDKDVYVDPPQLRGGYLPSPSNKDKLAGKEPFRPSQPGKTLTAKDGCFSPFTKAIPGNAAEEVKTTEHKVERAVFIPSSPEKTMRQTSIMFRSAHQ